MKKILLTVNLLFLTLHLSFAQTPLSMNGRLKLIGNQLSNQCGTAVQLRGMSTHSALTYKNCLTEAGVASLAAAGSDLIRLAIYTEQTGNPPNATPPYSADSVNSNIWIGQMVNLAEKYGMYVIIDWHVLSDQSPLTHQDQAQKFFATMSRNFKNKRNVIYEICNEPNGGTSWSTIKSYAQTIIPIIRRNDPEGIILVGTPEWSSKPTQAANDKLTGNIAYNVMYTFHFYSGSHYGDYQSELQNAASRIPVFVSEWGTTNADGVGGVNTGNSDTWIGIMKNLKVSWANWSFSDKSEESAVLTPGACLSASWSSKTTSGNYVFGKLSTADDFTQCQAAGDDDKDGVPNGDDKCAGTPAGTLVDATGCTAVVGDADKDGVTGDGVSGGNDMCANTPIGSKVNAWGCPMELNFSSNVCMGFNNYQGYARTDFTIDSLANIEYWNRPFDKSPVYSATTSNGQLIIKVTNADPQYRTMGFSFGKKIVPNGAKFDTTLYPLDIRKYPVVKFDMKLTPGSGYAPSDAVIDIQLEDVNGNSISTDNLKNLARQTVALNTVVSLSWNFTGGYLQSYNEVLCGSAGTPCYISTFDFSRVTKVKVWVNPGAGSGNWTRAPFNGTWMIDNFSVGYNNTLNYSPACTPTRDDDKDGVIQDNDRCPDTSPGSTVNASGCAQNQIDDDKDGVVNSNDLCLNTPPKSVVNPSGCAVSEADDDGDGVMNDKDLCPNTIKGAKVDATGCVQITTGITEDLAIGNLLLYPNPATDNLVIEQKNQKYNKAILMDMSGNIMTVSALNSLKESIDLKAFAKGIYMIQLVGSERSEYVRIVIQ